MSKLMEIPLGAIEAAQHWRRQHDSHITSITKGESHCYPPTNGEIFRPDLWKPAHWKWLIENHG